MSNDNTLFFDLETKADPSVIDMLPEIKAPSNYKDEEKIAAYVEEKRKEQIKNAALDPDLGMIVSLGYKSHPDADEVAFTVGYNTEDEASLIRTFWEELTKTAGYCCGYNIIGFDLPYLLRRSMILGINVGAPVLLQKYRTEPVTDLYGILYNWGSGHGLKWVAKRLGIKVPLPDVEGSMVATMSPQEICEYSISDTYLLGELYKKMKGVYLF